MVTKLNENFRNRKKKLSVNIDVGELEIGILQIFPDPLVGLLVEFGGEEFVPGLFFALANVFLGLDVDGTGRGHGVGGREVHHFVVFDVGELEMVDQFGELFVSVGFVDEGGDFSNDAGKILERRD